MEKEEAEVNFKIVELRLFKAPEGKFTVSWERGDTKAVTLPKSPNNLNVVVFNQQYHCNCNIFFSKTKINPKLVKFDVHIIRKEKKPEHFGKLSIDVTEFLGKKGFTRIETEFEKGKVPTPILVTEWSTRLKKDPVKTEQSDEDATNTSESGEWDVSDSLHPGAKPESESGEWDESEPEPEKVETKKVTKKTIQNQKKIFKEISNSETGTSTTDTGEWDASEKTETENDMDQTEPDMDKNTDNNPHEYYSDYEEDDKEVPSAKKGESSAKKEPPVKKEESPVKKEDSPEKNGIKERGVDLNLDQVPEIAAKNTPINAESSQKGAQNSETTTGEKPSNNLIFIGIAFLVVIIFFLFK